MRKKIIAMIMFGSMLITILGSFSVSSMSVGEEYLTYSGDLIVGKEIIFTIKAEDIDLDEYLFFRIEWFFGDDDVHSDYNLEDGVSLSIGHTYEEAGTYTVSVVAQSREYGCIELSIDITIGKGRSFPTNLEISDPLVDMDVNMNLNNDAIVNL